MRTIPLARCDMNMFRINDAYILALTVGLWAIVNVSLWSAGGFSLPQLWLYERTTGELFSGPVAPFTILMTVVTIAFSVYVLKRVHEKRLLSSVLLAITVPFGGISLFEIVYLNFPFFVRPSIFNLPVASQVELVSWLVLGFSTVRYWRASRLFYLSVAVFCLGFLSWSAIGYPHVYETANPFHEYALFLNVVTKISAFLIFLSLIHSGAERIRAFPV